MPLATGIRVGPYEIITPLGAGGMGEVYKARDTRLNRIIALKTLPADKVADPERKRRFLGEAQAASRLNHPNIVTIHDISEENGICFIAMEYVAGSTLDHANSGDGLSLQDAIKYAADIAEALAAAHAAGIIHRDLKPANIIITPDGRAKLLDFGLAKLIEPNALEAETATFKTIAGSVMGTAAYMSPEQAEGRELDARSDIFSFGVVFYEMLCGQRAFQGDSWISTLAAILRDEPRSLPDIKATIPTMLAEHVKRCLRKDPVQRFQTMLDVKQSLAEAALSPVTLTTATSSGAVVTTSEAANEPAASIAVLPFANLTGDKENEYFSDGLAEEIINALTKVPKLRVIARTSAFSFRGKEKEQDLRFIGDKLKVGTILEGSVRRAGNRIRVTAQLIKVADESHLWSERYDREMTDIFAIQDDIAESIAHALKVKFASPQRRATNIDAFQSYLKGLYWYQRYNPESLAKAKESFEKALTHDPGYAPAFAGLAVFYYGLGALSIKRMLDVAPLARSAAERALSIDPTLSEAHSVLGLVIGAVEYDWKQAERHFQAALAVDAVPPLVRLRYGLYFLTPQRRFDEAIEQYRLALETDPLSMMAHFGLASVLYCQRRYDDAIKEATRAVDIFPDYWLAHLAIGLAKFQKGLLPAAIASFETAAKFSPSFTLTTGFLAAAYVRSGNPAHAEKLMAEVKHRSSKQYASSACFGIYYAATGEADKMFHSLQAALIERDPYLTRMGSEPSFDPYHSDPRYRNLMNVLRLV